MIPQDVNVKRGNTMRLRIGPITRTDAITGLPSIPDITGWTLWLTAKSSRDDADVDALVQLETPVEIEIANQAAEPGVAYAVAEATVTRDWEPGHYAYDVQAKDPVSDDVDTVQEGTLKVSADVTRAVA